MRSKQTRQQANKWNTNLMKNQLLHYRRNKQTDKHTFYIDSKQTKGTLSLWEFYNEE